MKQQQAKAKPLARRTAAPPAVQRAPAPDARQRALGNARMGALAASMIHREDAGTGPSNSPPGRADAWPRPRRRGKCPPEEHQRLQDEVDRACGKKRKCEPHDDCPTLWNNMQLNAECMRARSVVIMRCFGGEGDPKHKKAVTAAVGAIKNCSTRYMKKCAGKEKQLEHEPAAQAEPEVDKAFMERMAAITGLTGTALLIYLIISEGSRLFPPRNLLPIP